MCLLLTEIFETLLLENKMNIVLHYRTLKQAISHGLKLITILSALKYDQKPWLKDYIDKITKLR